MLTSFKSKNCIHLTNATLRNSSAITDIDVSNCPMLETLSYGGDNLKRLNATGCSALTSVPSIPAIEYLDLSGCLMLDFNTMFLSPRQYLKTLKLSDCIQIENLKLYGQESLDTLDLSGCTQLKLITSNSIPEKLRWISMSGCKSLLPNFSYLACPTLEYIDMSYCPYPGSILCMDKSNLKYLNINGCYKNTINEFDNEVYLSNTMIEELYANSSEITSIVIRDAPNLHKLDVAKSILSAFELHNVPNLCALDVDQSSITTLVLYKTGIKNLDLINCLTLKELNCYDNSNLTQINLGRNLDIEKINCRNTSISSLDISSGSQLKEVDCSFTNISSLTINDCSSLETLKCSHSQIQNLRLHGAQLLSYLDYSFNPVVSVDIDMYDNLKTLDCSYTNVPLDITNCFLIESVNYTKTGLTGELDMSRFKELISIQVGVNQLTQINVSNLNKLRILNVGDNQLTQLDVSNLDKLEYLNFANNLISSIDLTGCSSLRSIGCGDKNNYLTELDLSPCPQLERIGFAEGTTLETLDLSKNTELKSIGNESGGACWIRDISIKELNISNCKNIKDIIFENSKIETLLATNCANLGLVSFNDLETAKYVLNVDVSGSPNFYDINLPGTTKVRSFKASGCSNLVSFRCHTLKSLYTLEYLDVSNCNNLRYLECRHNKLTSLDLTGCSALEELDCSNNPIKEFTLMDDGKLEKFDCHYTLITSQIPTWFDPMIQKGNFKYEVRYDYSRTQNGKGETVIKVTDNGFGWWYPGEPKSGEHKRQ